MPVDREQLILEEYKLSYAYGVSFSTMRGQVFAACITAVGLIAAFAKSDSFWSSLGTSLCLVTVALLATRMLAALNRGCVVFLMHAARMERKLGVVGFSSYFPRYLNKHPRDSGSYAFMLGAWLLSVAASFFAIFLLIAAETTVPNQYAWVIALSIGYVSITVWNGWRLWKYLHPVGTSNEIDDRLGRFAQIVTDERTAEQSHPLEATVGPVEIGASSTQPK